MIVKRGPGECFKLVAAHLALTVVCTVGNNNVFTPSLPTGVTANDATAACASILTRSQLTDSRVINIIGQAPWLHVFLASSDVPVAIFDVGNEKILPVQNLISDVVFFVTGNVTSLKEALNQVRRQLMFYARVIVWWPAGDTEAALHIAWDLEVMRLVVVSGTSRNQRIFGYREGCERGSRVARKVLVGECSQAGLLDVHGDIFPDLQRWNLQGCPLRVGSWEVRPELDPTIDPHGLRDDYELTSAIAPLAYFFAKRVKAKLKIIGRIIGVEFGGIYANGTAWGTMADVMYDHLDIVIEIVFRNITRDNLADLGPSFYTSCVRFFVPSGTGADATIFDLVVREFTPIVWALTGVAYVVIITVFAFSWWDISQNPVSDAAFFTLSALVGNSFVAPINTTRVKVLTVLWMVFCIVLSTAYQAELHSIEAAPPRAPEINSLPELEKSGLSVVGFPDTINELKRIAQIEGNATLLALSSRTETSTNLSHTVYRMTTKKDIAIFFEANALMFYAGRLEMAAGRKLVHEIPGFCASSYQIAFFTLLKGSRFTPVVIDVVTRAFDIGLFVLLEKTIGTSRPEIQQTWSQLGLSDLVAAFELLLLGMIASGLVFATEVWNRNKSRITCWDKCVGLGENDVIRQRRKI